MKSNYVVLFRYGFLYGSALLREGVLSMSDHDLSFSITYAPKKKAMAGRGISPATQEESRSGSTCLARLHSKPLYSALLSVSSVVQSPKT
jgi:hypothetical protein